MHRPQPPRRTSAPLLLGAFIALIALAVYLISAARERSVGDDPAGAPPVSDLPQLPSQPHLNAPSTASPLALPGLPRAAILGQIRERGGPPIPHARVCATPSSERVSARELRASVCTESGADGRYRLSGLLPVRHSVRANAPHYAPGSYRRRSESGRWRTLDLAPGQETPGIDIELVRGGVELRGVVKDLSGGEIAGAEVNADEAITFAGEDGTFTLWVRPGHTNLTARADGYAGGSARGVAPGHYFELYLTPEAVLIGQVVRAGDGAPVEGAHVRAEAAGIFVGGRGDAITGADGRFRVDGLEPGFYKAVVEAEDGYGIADAGVLLGLGETSEPQIVRVHPAFAVDGLVQLEGGAPCESGSVSLRDPLSGHSARTTLEGDGRAHLIGLLPGSYEVNVDCYGAVAEERYDPLVLSDRPLDGLRWRVRPGRFIRGVIVDPSGAPAADLMVIAEPKGAAPRARTTNGADQSEHDGAFELAGLLPGTYEISLYAWANPRALPPAPLQVTLPADSDLDGVRIELPAAGELRGQVRDPRGVGLANVNVSLKGDGMPLRTRTADDGSFRAEHVPVGEYRIIATRGFTTLRAPGTADDDLQGARVLIEAGGVHQLDLVVEPADGVIRGLVRDEDGGVVADAFIEATRESERAGSTARAASEGRWSVFFADRPPILTDADGRFRVDQLSPGKYTLRAHRKGGGEGIIEHIELGADVVVTITAAAELAGVVVLQGGGDPPERFTVEISDPRTGFSREDTFFRSAGAWRFPQIPPGTYKISVETPTASAEAEATVAAGEQRLDQRIELRPRITVRGRVVDADGAPVPGIRVLIAAGAGGSGFVFQSEDADKDRISDNDGRFEVTRAPAGPVRINLMPEDAEGFMWTAIPAQLPADAPVYELPPLEVNRARVARGETAGDLGFTLRESEPDADPFDPQLIVAAVRPGGPADRAGLRPGDRIVSVDGRDVRGREAFRYRALSRVLPGVTIRLGLERGVTLDLTAAPPP